MLDRRVRVGTYALCLQDEHLLLCRMSEATLSPGTWTLPGGGLGWLLYAVEATGDLRGEVGSSTDGVAWHPVAALADLTVSDHARVGLQLLAGANPAL